MPVSVSNAIGGITSAKNLAIENPANLGNFSKALQKGIQLACNNYSNNAGVTNLTPLGPVFSEVCAPYFNANNYGQPGNSPIVLGGQCDGKLYDVIYRVRSVTIVNSTPPGVWQDNGWSSNQIIRCRGPVTPFQSKNPNAGSPQTTRGVQGRNQTTLAIQQLFGATADDRLAATFFALWRYEIIAIQVVDGSADNCGNSQPAAYTGFAPTYNFNTNVSVAGNNNLSVNVSVGTPTVTPDGDYKIPINVGGITVNLGEGSSEVAPVANVPTEAAPTIPGATNDAADGEFPPAPEGTEYIGAIIEIVGIPPGEGSIVGTLPNLVFPRTVGNARLKLSVSGQDFLPVNHQIREDILTLIRPEEGIEVKGCLVQFPESGFQYTVTPLRKPISGV